LPPAPPPARTTDRTADPLLTPFRIKNVSLRNRIISTAHEPAYSEGRLPKDRYRLYHREKAKGGIALTMIGGSAGVSRDSPGSFGNLAAYDDAIVPWLRRLVDDCHAHGAAVFMQLSHLGRRNAFDRDDWLPVLAPSPVREPAHRAFPKQMEEWDIDRVLSDYVAAAERARAGGVDGIEIEAGGHLPVQFWSPATNRRDDAYGGDARRRGAFGLRLFAALRQALGPDVVLGYRMAVDEAWAEGLSAAEGIAVARELAALGLIDFLNVNRGNMATDNAMVDLTPMMGMPGAPHLAFAGEVRAATGCTVFHAGRIADLATARHAIAAGLVDMVAMTRAHLADPHIVAKLLAGREDAIRPCVGATYCLDRIYQGNDALCIHNPATGREAVMPHRVARAAGPAKRAVVVGAGPAGLEAARVLAERGHHVTLFEAADRPGGQVLLAARAPRRRELMGVIQWRVERIAEAGVSCRFGTYVEADTVLGHAPDLVVIATGGVPPDPVLEAGGELTTRAWDIIAGQAPPGREVLVYDDNGAHPGMQVVEQLARAGAAVELVTPERALAPGLGGMNHASYMRVFQRFDVRVTVNTRLLAVRREANRLVAVLGGDFGDRRWERRVDQVVVEHGTRPVDDLYFALRGHSSNAGEVDYPSLMTGAEQTIRRHPDGRFRLFRIGDAVAGRNVHAAIYDALRFAHTL
jgi:2,4-dienoyl-CoA reductase-like NADH-dependent reductase (Old Yellow Enzyme family)/thioredoxin reductase